MIRLEIPGNRRQARGWPGLGAPFAGHVLRLGIGRMPVLLIDDDARILEYARVASLEPVVEPPHRLIPPFKQRPVIAAIWEAVVPGSDPCLERRLHLLEHAWNAVAVAVLHPADQKGRDFQLVDRPYRRPPDCAAALMLPVVERHPRRTLTRADPDPVSA